MVTENEIRPKEIFDHYLKLSAQDGKRLKHSTFVKVKCPACLSASSESYLKKNAFHFHRCKKCQTLFCNPRPSDKQLAEFYQTSKSAKFWSEKFLPVVQDVRREKLVRPKVKEIVSFLEARKFAPQSICDVGAGHGFVLDELKAHYKTSATYAIEPDGYGCEVLARSGHHVHQGLLGSTKKWEGKMDFVTCFEVLEHVYSPLKFATELAKLTRKGGLTLVTTLGCEGFDIATLKEKSKAISPPHHLNFLSLAGFETLFKKAGFSEVIIQTPGKLDVDIVLNTLEADGFLKVLKSRGPEAIQEFQRFLVKHNLSSHTWIWAVK